MLPQRWRPLQQLVLARVREFYREPHAIFWVYGFPLLLAIGLGSAFSGGEAKRPDVDVQEGPGAERIAKVLRADGFPVEVHDEAQCRDRLVKGATVLYVIAAPDAIEYVHDDARSESVLARYWAEAALLRSEARADRQPRDQLVHEAGSRYIDWLLPGLVGMNLMGGGLFGVGFVLVDMRVRKLFKRLMATPMRPSDLLLTLIVARLLFLIPEMFTLLVVGRWMFGVPIYGSVVTLGVVILAGAMAFAGLGLLLGCRTEKTEVIAGYINAVMLPQYLLSGLFFSSRRFPDLVQPLIQALPLTQLNDALRAVMLEGAGFAEIGWRLAILAAWGVAGFALALRWFRWR